MENSKPLNKFIINNSEKFRKKLKELGTPQKINERTDIDEYKIDRWLKNDILPTTYDIADILNLYNLKPEELGATITNEDEYIKKVFMQRLKELKKERNVSQAKIAKDINVAGNVVTYWFNKGTIPKGATLQRLAKYFNVTVSYLLGYTDNRNADNEMIGKRLGMSDKSIAVREEIKNTNVYGKKFEEEIKSIFGFNHTDVSNYILSDIGLVDVFYGEALKVLSYYTSKNFNAKFNSLFNELEVDLSNEELGINDEINDLISMEIPAPYKVKIETMSKAILQKKISTMFDDFINKIINEKNIQKYQPMNLEIEEKKIKEQITNLKEELSNIEQIKKNINN